MKKDETGKLVETPKQLFTRIAVHAALPDLLYDAEIFDITKKQHPHAREAFDPEQFHEKVSIGRYSLNRYHLEALKRMYDRFDLGGEAKVSWQTFFDMLKSGRFNKFEKSINSFYELMVTRKFMPNTPAIANFGNVLGMGSACFVLGVEDSIESIMETLKQTAVVFKAGGGMGYNFSETSAGRRLRKFDLRRGLRPDQLHDVIRHHDRRYQTGRDPTHGANMGILDSNHPDVEKFITAKKGNKALRNFNISVLIMPEFWESYKSNKPYPLINPRTGQAVRGKRPPAIRYDCLPSLGKRRAGSNFLRPRERTQPIPKPPRTNSDHKPLWRSPTLP